jgi:hypothetical protein
MKTLSKVSINPFALTSWIQYRATQNRHNGAFDPVTHAKQMDPVKNKTYVRSVTIIELKDVTASPFV